MVESAEQNARLGAQLGANKALDTNDPDAAGSGARRAVRRPSAQQPVPLYQRTFARPGRLFAPPVPAARHVLLAMSGGALVFFIAGGRFDTMLDKMRGKSVQEAQEAAVGEVFQTVMGWGVLLSILVFMADTGVMAPLAIGFSWLIFLMILIIYGAEAAQRISSLLTEGKSLGRKPNSKTDTKQLGTVPKEAS